VPGRGHAGQHQELVREPSAPDAVILLSQLEQNAGGRLRMHKRNPASGRSLSRDLVHQAITGRAAGLECSIEVGNPVTDMMDAGPPLGEKLADRALRAERRKQLDLGVSEGERHDGGSIGDLRRVRFDSEDVAVEGERGLELGNCYTDVRDAGAISHGLSSEGNADRSSHVVRTTADLIPLENNEMGAANTLTVHVSDASFASEIEQADGLVLVDFWASWCGPCQIVAPILDQLAGEYVGKAKVAKVDVDSNQRTAMRFNVRSIPSILFFKNGQHVDTVIGAVPKATLEGKIKQHLI
jgi:thioredoxin 1